MVILVWQVELVLFSLPCLLHFILEGAWDKNKIGDRRRSPPTDGFTVIKIQCLASKKPGSEPEQATHSDFSKHVAGVPRGAQLHLRMRADGGTQAHL